MKSIRYGVGSLLLLAFLAGVSMAQNQRSFVSGLGSDGNPCTRTAPCRTFAQAISQTNLFGEVVALDSAGYGTFTVTQSVTVEAPPGVYAGISAAVSSNAIAINAGPVDTVVLRGLTVTNVTDPGSGIAFNSGLKLHVEGCVIDGFSAATNRSAGLSVLVGGPEVKAEVIDSVIRANTFGILVLPSSGTVQVTIDHVRLENNSTGLVAGDGCQVNVTNSVAANNGIGLRADTATSGLVQMNVDSTVVSGNSFEGVFADAITGAGTVQVNVARCLISSNRDGIVTQSSPGGVVTARVSGSTVTGNTNGLFNMGAPALLLSRGDNTVEGNTNDTSGTIGSYTAK